MEETKLLKFFEGKTIFITGATGYLAKMLVEKLLRVQPNVKKLYLLIRKPAKISVEQRLQEEVVDCKLFEVLREKHGEEFESMISSKVIPIAGDVSHEDLGIVDSELREAMWQEIDIIVNSAATTKFDERYDVAFGINALGAMHVREFAMKCSKIEMLLQVSTAFVHGTKAGVMKEEPIHMGDTPPGAKITNLDINLEKTIIEEKLRELKTEKLTDKEIAIAMKILGMERSTLHGWPNTYVFTKAMGEMIVERFKEKGNVVIIRPTIITSTFKDPFPGWIEGVKTLDAIFVSYGEGKLKFFVGDPDSTLDMIPGDMVVNCMVAAMAFHSKDGRIMWVYQVGSSRQNPILYGEIKSLMHRYLTQNPLHNATGYPVRVGAPIIMKTMASFHKYISIRYLPFLMILKFINKLFWNRFEIAYTNARRSVNQSLRLADLYKPYLFSEAIFDDSNTEKLEANVSGSKNIEIVEMLSFDPKCIDWDVYFINTHFPGLVKYVLNS